jgi:hypothetical protein
MVNGSTSRRFLRVRVRVKVRVYIPVDGSMSPSVFGPILRG